MTRSLTCLRCGDESPDVRMALVDLEAEAREDGEPLGMVTVAIVSSEGPAGARGMTYAEVPALYAHEPRCRDGDGCRRRVIAQQQPMVAGPSPTPDTEEEDIPWLL